MSTLLVRRAPGLPGVAVEVGIVGVALLANLLARRLTLDDLDVAVAHAHSLLARQERLGLDWEHAAQDAVTAVPWLGTFAAWFYVWGYLPVTAGALVVLFVRRPVEYAFLRNALVAGGIVGLPVYVLWPLAPPRLTDLGYTDTIATSTIDAAARPVGIANEIAAMPSFHVGYLVVVSVVVWRLTRSPLMRLWCVLHPLVMCWVVLATANHWVLDLPAGVLLAVVGLGVAGWIETRAAGPNGPVRRSRCSLTSLTREVTMASRTSSSGQAGNAIYGIGMFGAWVYFWMQADGFWQHVLAILEGIVWPAFAVYHGLEALDA